VGVDVLVKRDGRIGDARIVVSSGDAVIDASTLKAVTSWRLEPGRLNGKPADMWGLFTITFGPPGPPTQNIEGPLAEIQRLIEQRNADTLPRQRMLQQ